jgi:hypothetical protein
LLGYVELSLPSEYEKGIPREAFEGRDWRGGDQGMSVLLLTPPALARGNSL